MENVTANESQQQTAYLFGDDEWKHLGKRLSLSKRELEIVQLVFTSKSEAEISKDLAISPHTVHTHLGRLYHKLGVNSRVELVVKIMERYHEFCREHDSVLEPICNRRSAGECPFDEKNRQNGSSPSANGQHSTGSTSCGE
ncbi:helix-turn-helix transcriptional regulator [Aeoliella mucimassa]|uniref:HTH-type transcriptional regulator n=1 Tax=Aeoliella mucimassa TaxID=2527972 RepID=A0A518AVU2_9BACT|nr:helix-turn-helix transcriptional regulator [Aeoliella mucimassa]QDU58838.1 Putative HTH-type transcriptional regulator [Aeoliella mucimassa]